MSLSLCILASGSSGNCALVRLNGCAVPRHVLIDAGLSPRQTAKRLAPCGVGLDDIGDILLTHLDSDHLHMGWARALQRHPIRVHVHERHRRAAARRGVPVRSTRVFSHAFELDGTMIDGVPLAHDQLGSIGYVVEHDGARLGYATDLGRIPPELLDRLDGVHGLAIESNYDRQMQIGSARPEFLKGRIMGGRGHLSNEQALEAILHVDRRGALTHVALLHLSRQCNCPRLVRRLYATRAPHLLERLTLTSQHEPTPLLHLSGAAAPPRVGEQMALSWGRQ